MQFHPWVWLKIVSKGVRVDLPIEGRLTTTNWAGRSIQRKREGLRPGRRLKS
jgi:hypothetical protein